jgi:hypothetical protein
MVMGERGMADMGEMEMPLPDNTLPMMTGTGPFGPLEMGGMFSTLKVRRNQKPGDYKDPGWFKQPPGTRPYEWTGALPPSFPSPTGRGQSEGIPAVELKAVKPKSHQHH